VEDHPWSPDNHRVMVDRECHVGGHILAVTPLSSRLCGEGKVEVKQEASSVIQVRED